MVRFRVGNVVTFVDCKDPFTKERVDSVLYNSLSVISPNAKYSPLYRTGLWDGKVRFYKNSKFLTGLLPRALKALEEAGLGPVHVSAPEIPSVAIDEVPPLKGIDVTRFEKVQLPLLKEMLSKGRCSVKLATGGGKTEIIAALAKVLQHEKMLVLVHRIELLHQAKERLETRLDEEVGMIGLGKVDVSKRVTVGMVQTIFSRLDELIRWLKEDVKVLVVDECHHSSADTWKKISMCCWNASWRFGLSGTPITGDDARDWWLVGLTGEVVEGLRISDLVDMGYLVKPVVFLVVDKRLEKWKNMFKSTYKQVLDEVFNDVEMWEVVGDVIQEHVRRYGEGGVLVITERIAVCRKFWKYLTDIRGMRASFVTGETKDWQRLMVFDAFKEGKIPILVTTTILDEGVDVSRIRAIVFLCSTKSIVRVLQRIGRGVRVDEGKQDVKIYDFKVGARYLERHFKQRLKIYGKEGFEVRMLVRKNDNYEEVNLTS